jgi:hypothetical protein
MFFYSEDAVAENSDPYFSNVSLLLKGDGTNNSTSFIDSSNNNYTVTGFGNAKLSTVQSKFGGSSIAFDGNGDYLTIPDSDATDFGTGNFTVEGWIYFNSLANGISLISKGTNATNTGWTLYWFNNTLYFALPYISNDISYSFTPTLNTWYHLACTRESGTIRLFVNGVLVATQTNNTKNYSSNEVVRLGYSHSNNFLNGYVDDVRVTKGVARYTASFTPPAAL